MRMKLARLFPALALAGLLVAACGGSTGGGGSSPSATVPSDLSISSFTADFSYMAKLKALYGSGHGKVGVILPDTTSSTRYVDFDAPYLKKAFDTAGYSSSDYKIDNANGNDQTEISLAQADISAGASVLIMDPLNSTVGSQIQTLAAQKGVKLISYDRATFSGTSTYYVSFDNVQVGKLIGQGFTQCVSDLKVSNAKVFVLDGGEDSDPNAVSFAQGYNQVLWGDNKTPQTAGKTNNGLTLVGDQVAPGWDNTKGATIFQQAYTQHPEINATVEANDGLANAVIQVLKNKGVKANTIPTTGQDATLQGMANVLTGYQCGSVYKAVYIEAQAAVALATVLRAGAQPPSALVNGNTSPPPGQQGNQEPAVLLVPIWVNKANMKDTVLKDNFVKTSDLCSQVTTAVCAANGIS
jgi:D-xylose transport system substrate-binding protein